MSRQSIAPQRNLSLTEELERLEQSITLTLQGKQSLPAPHAQLTLAEIDHNFSRAHRIVTTNILPIVEQYGKHSEAVWEGSKVRGFGQTPFSLTDPFSSGNNSSKPVLMSRCPATKPQTSMILQSMKIRSSRKYMRTQQ